MDLSLVLGYRTAGPGAPGVSVPAGEAEQPPLGARSPRGHPEPPPETCPAPPATRTWHFVWSRWEDSELVKYLQGGKAAPHMTDYKLSAFFFKNKSFSVAGMSLY